MRHFVVGSFEFQSTLPRGERPSLLRHFVVGSFEFQSTLPRGERHYVRYYTAQIVNISIHAPARGATSRSHWANNCSVHFNPRSREGSDCYQALADRIGRNFNPRSREGSDSSCTVNDPNRLYFNPRSREGSDAVVSSVAGCC